MEFDAGEGVKKQVTAFLKSDMMVMKTTIIKQEVVTMAKLYHTNQDKVKDVRNAVEVINTEPIIAKACDGLLSLSVDLGLEVLRQMMEADVCEAAGPKGKHNPNRQAYRHGTDDTKVVLGGEKVSIKRPRVRTMDGGEVEIKSLTLFQNEDPLDEAILTRLLSGVSTRKLSRTMDSGVEDPACVSKSEASRRFAKGMDKAMKEFFSRPIEGSYPVLMIDGMGLGKMTIIAAMGIDAEGRKHILGLEEGGTENHEVAKALLADLISRGLDPVEPRLCVLDGGKALHKAVKETFGSKARIQRCQVHKKRNVLAHLPESMQENVSKKLTMAYRELDYDMAKSKLDLLVKELELSYPKAAKSLSEGLEETLTVHRLHVAPLLRNTLSNTNAMESANSVCAGILRRVTNFGNGKVTLRHAAAGFLEAERSFRRVNGYRDIARLKTNLAILTESEDWSKISIA